MHKPEVKTLHLQNATSVASVPILQSSSVSSSILRSVSLASGSCIVSSESVGANSIYSHVATTASGRHLPLSLSLASQPTKVHLHGSTAPTCIPINVLQNTSVVQIAMSQQHPTHLPRGAVAASALTLSKTPAVLRAGTSPAIQIPAAPSVPSVSVSVPGRPTVLSAIRPTTPPIARSTSPAVTVADHTRTNLIVHSTAVSSAGASALPCQPLQITLTQRINPGLPTINMGEGLKSASLAAIGPKTVHVAQATQPHHILAHPKLASTGVTGVGITPQHLPQQAVLGPPRPGALAMSAGVPAININSLSASVPASTVVTPVAAQGSSIPIAKVTPQRQQNLISSAIQTPIAVQTVTSSSDFNSLSDIMATQAGASQLLLSQTHRTSTTAITSNTTVPTLQTTVSSVASALASQHGDRSLVPPNTFNMTAPPQDSMWLQHFIYAHPPVVRPAIFLPRQPTEHNKLTSQTPNLAASLSHQLNSSQQTVLFNTRMMDNLRQPLPLSVSTTLSAAAVTSTSSIVTLASSDNKPVISFSSTNAPLAGITSSMIGIPLTSGDQSSVSSATALHVTSMSNAVQVTSALSPGMSLASAMTNLASRTTVASSIIAASAQQLHSVSGIQPQTPGTPGSSSNPSSSPRPSILRKRTLDGNTVIPRKPNFNLVPESHSPRPDSMPLSNVSSPKTPATENSQSSTDTALSSNDATTPTQNSHTDLKIKQEPLENIENGPSNSLVASPAVSHSGSIVDASPRKRARKQLFDVSHRNVSEELKESTSTDEETETRHSLKEDSFEGSLERPDEYIDEDGVRWTTERTKPSLSILGEYTVTWKPRCNHFLRHSDVRPKDDRRPTVNELANQRSILQKSSGWKLFHVAAQLEDLIENEHKMHERISDLKDSLAARLGARQSSDSDSNVLQELVQANLQRCQLISDQLHEAKQNMLNILNHRPKIQEIIHKNLSKRPIKKKERT